MDRTVCVIIDDSSSSLGSVILGAGSKSMSNLTDRFDELLLLLLFILSLTSRSSMARLTRLPHFSDDERNEELSPPPDERNDELSILSRLLVLDENIVCVVAVV